MQNFLAALGRRDKQALLALVAEDLEWIIPGDDWPLANTYRGNAGLEELLQKANETVETSFPQPPEFIAQGGRVLVVGFATGKIKATNKSSRITGSSTSQFEMANCRVFGSTSIRKHWPGPPRSMEAQAAPERGPGSMCAGSSKSRWPSLSVDRR